MINTRSFVISFFFAVLCMPLIYAQDLSSYRGFQLGMSLQALAKQAGMKPSEAKVVYQRPAVIQELEWWPRSSDFTSAGVDPVKGIQFSFYNGELYRILVSYDPQRTEGLTDKDLMEGISALYGAATAPVAKVIISPPSQVYSDSEKVIACWEDSRYSINLFRLSYGSAPGMLFFSRPLDALAQVAIVQAIRLNAQEAPQREIDRQKQEDANKLAAEQKARPVNKVNFRP
jgi:hypothetical protein